MAVTVTLTTLTEDGVREQISVQDGDGFEVREGTLVVLGPDGKVEALVTAGQWLAAELDHN